MYQTGKDRESLLALLESLSELTGIDRTVRSGQKFSIDAEIIDHGMKWQLEADPKGYSSSGIETARGKGYPSLIKTLKGINVEAKADERIVIIALVEVCEARNYDGRFHTIWCLIDPCEVGFDEKDHCVDRETGTVSYTYKILELDLSESEYKCCCASKLAFYNEFTRVLYPIQECAYSSISRMLDCACVFKYMDSPVVSASFLAQRLAGCRRTIRFVYRKRSERVRPLISIVGGAYTQLSQYEFVKDATDTIQSKWVAKIESWSVSDELTKVVYSIEGLSSVWKPQIEVQVSDTVGHSLAVSAYISMGHGRLLLKRNSASHWDSFENNRRVKKLFSGMDRAITEFANRWNTVSGETVNFGGDMLSKYEKILGKKRFAKLTFPKPGQHLLGELVYQVVDRTYTQLNPRWEKELEVQNMQFFHTFADTVKTQKKPDGDRSERLHEKDAPELYDLPELV